MKSITALLLSLLFIAGTVRSQGQTHFLPYNFKLDNTVQASVIDWQGQPSLLLVFDPTKTNYSLANLPTPTNPWMPMYGSYMEFIPPGTEGSTIELQMAFQGGAALGGSCNMAPIANPLASIPPPYVSWFVNPGFKLFTGSQYFSVLQGYGYSSYPVGYRTFHGMWQVQGLTANCPGVSMTIALVFRLRTV